MTDEAKCPVLQSDHSARGSQANQHWWPNQLNSQHPPPGVGQVRSDG